MYLEYTSTDKPRIEFHVQFTKHTIKPALKNFHSIDINMDEQGLKTKYTHLQHYIIYFGLLLHNAC